MLSNQETDNPSGFLRIACTKRLGQEKINALINTTKAAATTDMHRAAKIWTAPTHPASAPQSLAQRVPYLFIVVLYSTHCFPAVACGFPFTYS